MDLVVTVVLVRTNSRICQSLIADHRLITVLLSYCLKWDSLIIIHETFWSGVISYQKGPYCQVGSLQPSWDQSTVVVRRLVYDRFLIQPFFTRPNPARVRPWHDQVIWEWCHSQYEISNGSYTLLFSWQKNWDIILFKKASTY